MSSHLNRRNFLRNSAGATALTPITLRTLVGGIVTGLVNKAIAMDNGVIPLNYVKLWLHDGMERWYFDGAHAPNGKDGINLGTRYNRIKSIEEYGGKNYLTELEYALTNSKVNGKFYLPYLWESTLPGLEGNISMKELAKNMLTIRGVDTGIGFDAHGNNVTAAEHPFGYPTSLGGLASSVKSYSLPIAYNGGGSTPKSPNLSSVKVDPSSIANTLDLFNGSTTKGFLYKTGSPAPNEVRALVDEFIGVMKKNLPASKQKIAESVIGTRKAALNLMDFTMSMVNEVQDSYNEAKAVYTNVINQVITSHEDSNRQLKKLDDVILSNPSKASSSYIESSRKEELSMLYQNWTDDPFRGGNWQEFNENFNNLSFNQLINSLALSETYLKYNITNSLALTISSMGGDISRGLGDVHNTGGALRMFAGSKLYQAIATGLIACLSRIDKIKDTEGYNVGKRTVFHLRSEFDRSPLGDNGSNHLIRNCHETFFSNMIQGGPYIIGNVKKSNQWAAPLKYASNKVIEYKNIYSTVQQMCGLERDRNFEALVRRNGDKLEPMTDECEDV